MIHKLLWSCEGRPEVFNSLNKKLVADFNRNDNKDERVKLSPEKFAEMLKGDGVNVSTDQATAILKFLKLLADFVVSDYLRK